MNNKILKVFKLTFFGLVISSCTSMLDIEPENIALK